jgi:hypothetical protein
MHLIDALGPFAVVVAIQFSRIVFTLINLQ